MDSSNKESISIFHKLNPIDSFKNWSQNLSNKNNTNKWRINEKRFAAPERKRFAAPERKRFGTNFPEMSAVVLGPGAGAGIGCGVGLGFGLVGGVGVGSGPWRQVHPVLGLGFGCGLGAGFGYGIGSGFGSSWESIKVDLFGFKEEKKKKNPRKPIVADW